MDSPRRDYYEILGIPHDADKKAIKTAFRKLAMKVHPDRNKAPDANEKFREIAEAYGVLSDPQKRAQYDARGFEGVAEFTPEDLFGGIDLDDIFGGLDLGRGKGGSLFDQLFGFHPRRPSKGRDLELAVGVTLEQVNNGGETTVHVNRPSTCPTCHGTGAKPGTQARRCDLCGGSGRKVISNQPRGGVTMQQITICPECHGRGTIIDQYCPECDGRGQIEQAKKLKVKIPVGVEEGTWLRIEGHGLPSPEPGGQPGDLYAVIHTIPDSRFERREHDLWRTETLEVADAVLGTHIKVPTLDGTVDVKVPHGMQPGEILRLRGKGLSRFGGNAKGDLNLRINIHIPEHPSKEEGNYYEKLHTLSEKRQDK
jgi:molecular chaperone DnaJ